MAAKVHSKTFWSRFHHINNYDIRSCTIQSFQGIQIYDLLDDRCIDGVTVTKTVLSFWYKANRFNVATGLFSDTWLYLMCHYFVLTTSWHHLLWSITKQTLRNMEPICQVNFKQVHTNSVSTNTKIYKLSALFSYITICMYNISLIWNL